MVFVVELILLFVWHVAYGIVLLGELAYGSLCVVAGIFEQSLELCNDVLLLLQVYMFFVACSCICGIACFKELVAGSEEVVPQLITVFLRYHADGLPFLLQCDEFVAC